MFGLAHVHYLVWWRKNLDRMETVALWVSAPTRKRMLRYVRRMRAKLKLNQPGVVSLDAARRRKNGDEK
jgi:hypothetical protein